MTPTKPYLRLVTEHRSYTIHPSVLEREGSPGVRAQVAIMDRSIEIGGLVRVEDSSTGQECYINLASILMVVVER
jgi:hypothetical protein